MGADVCAVCVLLINLSGGGEHFLIIDYHYTSGCSGHCT